MKMRLVFVYLIAALSVSSLMGQSNPGPQGQKTWTYTYIKAKEGMKVPLRSFLEKNWFAMDSIAVTKGLFNQYELIENETDADSKDWDYIVAVEYFTEGTYEDIQEEWGAIRKNHKKVLINGLDFNELGSVIKSEKVRKHTYR